MKLLSSSYLSPKDLLGYVLSLRRNLFAMINLSAQMKRYRLYDTFFSEFPKEI